MNWQSAKRFPPFLVPFLFSLAFAAEGQEKPQGQENQDVCVSCHQGLEGRLGDPVKSWRQSIHREVGVSCKDCHGGNSSVARLAMNKAMGYTGVPRPVEVPVLCARCHADVKKMRPYKQRTDQYAEYQLSVHGQRLAKGDTRVATCTSCHGAHEIRRKSDPQARVYHARVPQTCAKCHSDAKYMASYKIPTDQFDHYQKSYHGQILMGKIAGKDPSLAPNCAHCHGVHGANPPGVKEVAAVCGNCHSAVARHFREGPHERAVQQTGMPKCITCHGNHEIPFPALDALTGTETGHCGSCHDAKSEPYAKAQKMKDLLQSVERSLQTSRQGIDKLKAEQLEVSELEGKMTEAAGKLAEARPLTHAMQVDKMNSLTSEALKILGQNQKLIAKFEEGLRERVRTGIILLSLIGLVAVMVYLKGESLSKEQKKKEEEKKG